MFYPSGGRSILTTDLFIQTVAPNGPVFKLPAGGTWSLTRLQFDIDGNIAEVKTTDVAGGEAANISNANAQCLIAYRKSY